MPNKQQITKAMIIAYEYSGDFATAKSKMEEYMKDYPDDEDAAREYQFWRPDRLWQILLR